MVIDGLRILGVLMGSEDFATHFLDEVLSHDLTHINDLHFMGNVHVVLNILSSYVVRQPFYLM